VAVWLPANRFALSHQAPSKSRRRFVSRPSRGLRGELHRETGTGPAGRTSL